VTLLGDILRIPGDLIDIILGDDEED